MQGHPGFKSASQVVEECACIFAGRADVVKLKKELDKLGDEY